MRERSGIADPLSRVLLLASPLRSISGERRNSVVEKIASERAMADEDVGDKYSLAFSPQYWLKLRKRWVCRSDRRRSRHRPPPARRPD